MEKVIAERSVCCSICGNYLFKTCVDADIFIKCARCNNHLHARIVSGRVTIDITQKDNNKKTA